MFTGQRQEADLGGVAGLYFYKARWYDAYLNRWLQPDSIIPDPNNSIDWDRYAYARNNPVKYTDPSGHAYECGVNSGSCEGYQAQPFYTTPGNAESAVEISGGILKAFAGSVYEPIDWAIAASDGFQWYDTVGMLPFIPAFAGRWGNDVIEALAKQGIEVIPASNIRFTQDSILWSTQKGLDLEQLTISISNGWIGDPLRVVDIDGVKYSLDNRRLAASKLLDINVPIKQIDIDLNSRYWEKRFTTVTEGLSIIVRRLNDSKGIHNMIINNEGFFSIGR